MIMRIMAAAGLAVMAGGCSPGPTMDVRQFWFPAASPYGFSGSYAWVEAESEGGYSPDYHRLLRGHVDRVLGAKGYSLADPNKADFWVSTYFGRRTNADPGHESFDQAAIVIEALERGSGTVLWRGWLQTRIAYDMSPAKRRARLRIGIEKILKDFPAPRR